MNRSDLMMNIEKRWHILRHPNPTMIGDIFSKKKQVSLTDEERAHPLPDFEYFIPFCEIQFRPSMAQAEAITERDGKYQPKLDGNALRSDLHSFIFVYGDESLVDELLKRSWNRGLKVPIRALLNERGRRIQVSQQQMNTFRNAIRQMDFQVCEGVPVGDEVREGDKVVVIGGPMVGSEGVITEIRERQGHISLTVAFDMFGNLMKIAVPGIEIADVRLRNKEAERMLVDPVLSNFENELIELLCHRHGEHGSIEQNKEDQKKLSFLYRYANIQFEDPVDATKFSALMLICSYLMNDKEEIARRTKEVSHLLESLENHSEEPAAVAARPLDDCTARNSSLFILHSSLICYLQIALFIATHDCTFRQKAKAYRQSHPDCPLSIRRFLSIAKKIKAKKPVDTTKKS